MPPPVTILMPVFNGSEYLSEAIESILNQTFGDFEFLVVNDGSTDASGEILQRYHCHDHRLRVYHQQHLGLIPSLNRGFHLAKGKYVARMDADDVSHPERIATQVAFMQSQPDCVLLGTAADLIDSTGNRLEAITPPHDCEVIKRTLHHGNAFIHGSIIMLHAAFDRAGGYRESAYLAEDYDLWCRVAQVWGVTNLTARLYSLRIHQGSVSARGVTAQLQARYTIRAAHYGTPQPSWAERRTARADAHLNYTRLFEVTGQHRAARTHLLAAWAAKPWSPTVIRTLIRLLTRAHC